jgi:hypothetical protein
MRSLPPRCGAYAFDAPYAPLLMALGGACLLALSAWGLWRSEMNSTPRAITIIAGGVGALWLFLNAGIFVHTTRAGSIDAHRPWRGGLVEREPLCRSLLTHPPRTTRFRR